MNAAWVRTAVTVATAAMTAACFRPPQVTPRSDANFAAHVDHRGLIVDRMRGSAGARLVSAGTLPFSGGPQLVLTDGGATHAALWVGNGHETVRAAPQPEAALLGEVQAEWDAGDAVRLSIAAADGRRYRVGRFHRIDDRHRAAAIGEPVAMTFDTRGTYVAEVRDSAGAPIGWLRVQVAPRGAAVTRTYDGDLPPALNGPLGVAAVAAVDAQITAMRRAAVNPYLGN